MSAFSADASLFKRAVLEGMEAEAGMTVGENGHACYTVEGLGDSLLALFDTLFQGIDEIILRDSLRTIIVDAQRSANMELISDLFVLAFSARLCRGGKGAKLPFYQCLKMLYEDFPGVVIKLLPLIPSFGYWKDYFLLLRELQDSPVEGVDYTPLSREVWRIYADQLLKDYAVVIECVAKGVKPSISFAGKYAPREKKHFARSLHAVRELALLMFPPLHSDLVVIGTSAEGKAEEEEVESSGPAKPDKRRYREVVSALSAALDVPEVKMCSHHYADVNMAAVPSRCLKLNVKAFSNELVDKDVPPSLEATGNRFPEDVDRVQARRNLINALVRKGVKGAQIYPHEFVSKAKTARLSLVDKLALDGQWTSMRENMVKMISERAATTEAGGVAPKGLGKLIPMSDVSGSMSGTPMDVSIGLGILCSELNHPAFKDLVLCFSGDAEWHSLSGCSNIVEKVLSMSTASWGMNTNFYKAMDRILSIVCENRLQQEDIPNLLVVSDMQFDTAAKGGADWNSAYANIESMFREAGLRTHGAPLTPPIIVFWNVRASVGFPAKSDQKGVVMLSGFSPALLKFVLSGELEREDEIVEIDEVTKEVVTKAVKRLVTPVETMYEALHEEVYKPIREVLGTCLGELRFTGAPLSRPYFRKVPSSEGEEGVIEGIKRVRPFQELGGERRDVGRGRGGRGAGGGRHRLKVAI